MVAWVLVSPFCQVGNFSASSCQLSRGSSESSTRRGLGLGEARRQRRRFGEMRIGVEVRFDGWEPTTWRSGQLWGLQPMYNQTNPTFGDLLTMGSNHFGNGMILQVGHQVWGDECMFSGVKDHMYNYRNSQFCIGGGFNMFQTFFKFHPLFQQDSYFDQAGWYEL